MSDIFPTLAQKIFGASELINALSTIHTPLDGIRKLLKRSNVALSQAFIAYIEFVTIVPFVLTQIIHPMGKAVGYPALYQGSVVENAVAFYFFAAIVGGIGFLAIYLIPRHLVQPSTKARVIAANLYLAMYAAVYIAFADIFKIAIWALTENLTLPDIIGNLILVGVMALKYYILRRVLKLSWITTVIVLTIATVILISQNELLSNFGLIGLQ